MTSQHQLGICEQELHQWRWKLEHHPEQSKREIASIIKGLAPLRHHYTELARWRSQLQNGVVCPRDFTKTRRPSS